MEGNVKKNKIIEKAYIRKQMKKGRNEKKIYNIMIINDLIEIDTKIDISIQIIKYNKWQQRNGNYRRRHKCQI